MFVSAVRTWSTSLVAELSCDSSGVSDLLVLVTGAELSNSGGSGMTRASETFIGTILFVFHLGLGTEWVSLWVHCTVRRIRTY